jgi:hypothetical protein
MRGTAQLILEKFAAKTAPLFVWFRKVTIVEKLFNPFGIMLFVVFGILFAFGTAHFGLIFAVLMIGGILAIPILFAIVTIPEFGIIVILLLAKFSVRYFTIGAKFSGWNDAGCLAGSIDIGLLYKTKTTSRLESIERQYQYLDFDLDIIQSFRIGQSGSYLTISLAVYHTFGCFCYAYVFCFSLPNSNDKIC